MIDPDRHTFRDLSCSIATYLEKEEAGAAASQKGAQLSSGHRS